MSNSEFVDPAGVNDENLSTARDITKAIIAASKHPVLMAVSAPHWYTHLNQMESAGDSIRQIVSEAAPDRVFGGENRVYQHSTRWLFHGRP